jgi:biotin transport system permease protein
MADMILFEYRHGLSLLHQLDVRFKLFAVCLFSLCMVKADIPACLLFLFLLSIGFRQIDLSLIKTIQSLKLFLLLLGFICLARTLSTPGESFFKWGGLTMTRQGLAAGIVVSFRFLMIMLTGLVFSTTTRLAEIKQAVQWGLKPIPLIPENRVAVMIGLSLGFIPVLFKHAQKISDARNARCGQNTHGFFHSLNGLMLPLLKKTFISADHLAMAMASRGYTDDRTPPSFNPGAKDVIFFFASLAVGLILVVL